MDELKVLRGFVEHEAIIFPRLLHLAPAISKVIVDVDVVVVVVVVVVVIAKEIVVVIIVLLLLLLNLLLSSFVLLLF